MTIVAIHQPNFFPWLGWFDKLARADLFILLDSVPLQLTGGNYTNRVQVLVGGEPKWVTMPLARGSAARSVIASAAIADDHKWRRKLSMTIRQGYARARHFDDVMPVLTPLLENPASELCDYNIPALMALSHHLSLDPARFKRASELPGEGSSTALLASLVRAVGGSAYLTGGGASYQEDQVLAEAGLKVIRQSFQPVPYEQVGAQNFAPGLSVIDAVMNMGFQETSLMLKGSCR
jgi:WbqC-like protein family